MNAAQCVAFANVANDWLLRREMGGGIPIAPAIAVFTC